MVLVSWTTFPGQPTRSTFVWYTKDIVKLYFHLFLQSDQHFHGLTHPEGEPPILFFVDNIFTR